MFEKINEMKRQRKKLVDEARALHELAEGEKRALSGEETEKYNKLMDEVRSLSERIRREEELLSHRDADSAGPSVLPQPGAHPGETRDQSPLASAEYRSAFWQYTRRSLAALMPDEHRALSVGSDPEGGYLVPDEFQRELVQALAEENVMRALARVIRTGSGDRQIPVVVDHGTAAWTGENQAFHESDAEFAQVTLGAHKLSRITKVSEELLNDSAFDVAGFLRDAYARTFGGAEERGFIAGTGTGQPRGVLLDAQVGVTAAASDAITDDEIMRLYHSLRRPYRPRATWLMHDSTALALRLLKDSQGRYLWQDGLQAGQPDRLLGRPVVVSDYMPELGLGNKAIAFGDFSYYWIADRQNVAIQRLIELYAAQGQVGFRMFTRSDGRLVLPEAIQVLQCA